MPDTAVASPIHALTDDLRRRAGFSGELRTDDMSRALFATDASMYQIMPLAVCFPRTRYDVQAAVKAAAQHGVPVLGRGGGSALAGQTVAEALVMDFSRYMGEVLELDVPNKRVRVEPGIVLDVLNDKLAPHGLMVGPDPASSSRATIGGMMANNATGTHSILYGSMVDHVLAAQVVLADGATATFTALDAEGWTEHAGKPGMEGQLYQHIDALLRDKREVIERDMPAWWRRAGGYRLERLLGEEKNLATLLCGSEGTLAIATSITLNLVDKPKRTALGVVHFDTRRAALEATTTILETKPTAVELLDALAIEQCRLMPEYASKLTWVEGAPGAVQLTEFYGDTEAELAEQLSRLEQTLRDAGHTGAIVRALSPEQIGNVMTIRKAGLGLLMSVKGDHKPHAFIEDAAVPVEHLAAYIEKLEAAAAETQTRMVVYAHASAGCLHVRPFINTKDPADVEKMQALARTSAELVKSYGGDIASEHGQGRARSWLGPDFYGQPLYDAFVATKRAFDPDNRFNPGNIIDAAPMDEDLRMGPTYETLEILEQHDWSADGGFARSVELCNGNGVCRKLDTGTMCPSYMVTLDEEHSTRGRANALRNALSGTLPDGAFTSERMKEVMDLCIQCKGCKSECPSAVDMGKMKQEWQYAYWREHDMPRREKMTAEFPEQARRWSGPSAKWVNRLNSTGLARWMMGRIGFTTERALPGFASEPFHDWFRKQKYTPISDRAIVLFHDTFNTHQHPEVAIAATEFLRRAGYDVMLPSEERNPSFCCGRTYLSKGMLDKARANARYTVDVLYPHAEAGLPIVGLEPSCILTLRDEFLSLLPGDERAHTVARQAVTFEELVAQQVEAEGLNHLKWKDEPRHVLLHGHCHQKAMSGMKPSVRCLSANPNFTVQTVDSGCCGMAGSFGYEKEHYAISKQMAERRLVPAVQALPPNALVVAAGTSCRHQIADLAHRDAIHPAQALLDALEPEAAKA